MHASWRRWSKSAHKSDSTVTSKSWSMAWTAVFSTTMKTAKTWGPKTFVRDHVTIAGQLPAYLGAYVGPKSALAPKLTDIAALGALCVPLKLALRL